jgi:hypothetical protein
MPLDDGITYTSDYAAISNHSLCHNPPVVGAWPEAKSPAKTWDDMKPKDHYPITERPQTIYLCADANCDHWFSNLNEIPLGWTVTTEMVRNTVNTNSILSYRCLCPAHQENNYAPSGAAERYYKSLVAATPVLKGDAVVGVDMAALGTYSVNVYNEALTVSKIRETIDRLRQPMPFTGISFDHALCACGAATETCLNPDAVAVKWYECALCGRTRNEVVKAEVW